MYPHKCKDAPRREGILARFWPLWVLFVVMMGLALYGFVHRDDSSDEELDDSSSSISHIGVTQQTFDRNITSGEWVSSDSLPEKSDECGVSDGSRLVWKDDAFVCMTRAELSVRTTRFENEASALLDPLVQSLNAGASPEMVLRELVAMSCDQALLENLSFWRNASRLYTTVREEANPDTFVSKWPADFAVAVGKECFKK